MDKKGDAGCVNCAYVDKEGKGMWCPFHDLPVTTRNVCKFYLSEYDTPQWIGITKSLAAEKNLDEKTVNFTKGDKVAFVITAILFGVSLWWMLFWITEFYFW